MAAVVRAEESFGPDKEASVVFVPANSFAGLECGGDFRNALNRSFHRLKKSRQENGAAFVSQRQRLLRWQSEATGSGVIADESARGLRGEPLAHIALGGIGFRSEFGRGDRSCAGHGFVQA